MSNIGTSLKAMGRIDDAERWWRKAISLKPVYWDAIVGTKNFGRTEDRTNGTIVQPHGHFDFF